MKCAHANKHWAAIFAVATCLMGICGCRAQQGIAVNPFLTPDRVPPPATRALLPGQAQPYYPGDPLPAMQSTIAPHERAATLGQLASNAPASSPAAENNSNVAKALAFSDEPTVAIPADNGSLRFPIAHATETSPLTALAANQPGHSPPAPASSVQTVVLAAYDETARGATSARAPNHYLENVPAVQSPWRSPQLAAAPPGPPNEVAVRLRAVLSPAMPSSSPRIRLPGYSQPPKLASTSHVDAAAYGTIVQPAFGGLLQTVQTTAIVPNALDSRADLAALPASPSNDGFRPRSSMR